jgi:FtsP/CotA-like multicopper oxidase with cupredoxin domain
METTRREFLRAAVGSFGLAAPWAQKHHAHVSRSTIDEGCITGLARFVDRMPIPPVAQPTSRFKWATYYEVTMAQVAQKLHRDLPPTTVWTYDGVYPGPTFEVLRDERVAVNWINSLPTHLVDFQILDRQPFDVDAYNASGTIKFTAAPSKPEPGESAWKDVVRCPPGEVTRIIMRFGDFAGRYVWHCHILEHEDNEMMPRLMPGMDIGA